MSLLTTFLRVDGTDNTIMYGFISGYTQNQVKSHKIVIYFIEIALFSYVNKRLL